jgi:hypothetical protein
MIVLHAVFGYYYFTAYAVYQMDISSPMMLALQKCTSLAWNLSDGHRQEEARKQNGGVDPEKPVLITSHQRRVAISELPSLFHFFSWMVFPISLSYGPSLEYKLFLSNVERTEQPLRCRLKLFWQQLAIGVFSIIYFFKPSDLSYVYDPEFLVRPFIYRLGILWLHMEWSRLKCASLFVLHPPPSSLFFAVPLIQDTIPPGPSPMPPCSSLVPVTMATASRALSTASSSDLSWHATPACSSPAGIVGHSAS